MQTVALSIDCYIWKCAFVLITVSATAISDAHFQPLVLFVDGLRGRQNGAAQPAPRRVVCATPREAAGAAAIARAALTDQTPNRKKRNIELELQRDDADDVIDLGAPRLSRLERKRCNVAPLSPPCRSYVPNPRLYPGNATKPQPRKRRPEVRRKGHSRCRKRTLCRPVPNSRLYRPAAPKPSPPPAQPRASWPPPAPPRPLDTASRVALRLGERRQAARVSRSPLPVAPHPPPPVPGPPLSRHLVVKLPATATAAGGDSPEPARYRPHSKYFCARSSPHRACVTSSPSPAAARLVTRAMDATSRHSASPEDCSDGNETLSAPSEFLAEFLSAIMQRQYAEALKYCRLILQYEPHNATARGFYPLLQHKLQQHATTTENQQSSSEETSAHSCDADSSPPRQDELMEQAGDSDGEEEGASEGSVASQSSLELDSEPSLELSRRTDSGSGGSGTGSGSAACWESTGSASRSDADNNGNAPPLPSLHPCEGDLENDNAAVSETVEPHHSAHLKTDPVSSLRRLRAQFACSIK